MENTPPAPAAKGGRGKKGGVRAAARQAGVSQTTAQRHAAKLNQTKSGSVSEEADKAEVRKLYAAVEKAEAERDAHAASLSHGKLSADDFIKATHKEQAAYLDDIGIEFLLKGMSDEMRELIRERLAPRMAIPELATLPPKKSVH